MRVCACGGSTENALSRCERKLVEFCGKRLRIGVAVTLESNQFVADLHLVVSDIEAW